MRQLLPFPCDPVDPAELYGDLPSAGMRPAVRLNMIASIDGATAVAGLSGGLGGPADQALFAVLRSQADVVLVAAGTVRAERGRQVHVLFPGDDHVRQVGGLLALECRGFGHGDHDRRRDRCGEER